MRLNRRGKDTGPGSALLQVCATWTTALPSLLDLHVRSTEAAVQAGCPRVAGVPGFSCSCLQWLWKEVEKLG